ncbi:class I SAM-dependent methyltransferase [Chloroflexota bacterium]
MRDVEHDYQPDFYTRSKKVGDPASRRQKALKIIHALERYSRRPLRVSVCLDIGCSSGLISAAVSSLSRMTLGLDYDRIALEASDADTRSKVGFVRGDAMHLPFVDGVVDIAVCAQVYEHVPDASLMMEELSRVLAPRGTVFFSGPNWLFPIEPHYFLPFLHWLPGPMADAILRLTGKGDSYYERLRTLWGLRRLTKHFEVRDITVEVLQEFSLPRKGFLGKLLRLIPESAWRILTPIFPSYNWILYKPET